MLAALWGCIRALPCFELNANVNMLACSQENDNMLKFSNYVNAHDKNTNSQKFSRFVLLVHQPNLAWLHASIC